MVLLDDLSSQQNDLQLHSIAHGVVLLEQLAIDYGAQRRRLRVVKMRGIDFRADFMTSRSSMGVSRFIRGWWRPNTTRISAMRSSLAGTRNWNLLGGGLERGTNALLIGAAGVGKSSLALTYAIAAAARQERS